MNAALRTVLPALLLTLAACAHKPAPAPPPGPPRPYPLLPETAERETAQLETRREDVEVDTRDFERIPRVVAVGETPLIELKGARARLYGDEKGTTGWSVDNFVLFEVLDANDRVLARGNAGFAPGVRVGPEHIDNLGGMAFTFDPGQIDITRLLPADKPFKVRATALDIGGVGRVSPLWLILDESQPRGTPPEDDLRGQ